MKRRSVLFGFAAGAAAAAAGAVQEQKSEARLEAPIPGASLRRRGRFAGRRIDYSVIARADVVQPLGAAAAAEFFSYSYIAAPTATGQSRPVIFAFNGGPGSSSASLHLSGLGPKRIRFGDSYDGRTLMAGLPLIDSDLGVLDSADLVFVDPPGTGYSRGVVSGDPATFWTTSADSRACANFIRTWLMQHKRWQSPLYLLGESYGTVRLAVLVRDLMGGTESGEMPAVPVAGVMLVASVVNRTQLVFHPSNDVYFQVYLPTFAATARYHGRGLPSRTLPDLLREVREFTIEKYGPALYLGNRLGNERRAEIARALAAYTGLSSESIARANLRIPLETFAARLLEDKGSRVGKYDTRTSISQTFGEGGVGTDPSMAQLQQAFARGIGEYFSSDLELQTDRPYRMINFAANAHWKHDVPEGMTEYSDVSALLANAMTVNPRMRLMTLSGRYDLDAPFMGVEHTFDNPMFPSDRVFIRHYDSGHMCYVGEDAVRAVTTDVRAFVSDTAPVAET